MSTRREPRQWQRLFCPHCGEKVSKSTYYRHREEYYDARSGEWKKGSDSPISAGGSQREADTRETGVCDVNEKDIGTEDHDIGGKYNYDTP